MKAILKQQDPDLRRGPLGGVVAVCVFLIATSISHALPKGADIDAMQQASVQAAGTTIRIAHDGKSQRYAWDQVALVWSAVAELAGASSDKGALTLVVGDVPFRHFTEGSTLYVRSGGSLLDVASAMANLFWGGDQLHESWMQVGFARWMGIEALRLAGFGAMAEVALAQEIRPWLDDDSRDQPLKSVDLSAVSGMDLQVLSAKALAFNAVVRSVLGEHFAAWAKAMLGKNAQATTNAWIQSIQDRSGKPVEAVFKGWVLPGSYGSIGRKQLMDDDGDGLIDVLESVAGSHAKSADTDQDGYSDGFEYWHKGNAVERAVDPKFAAQFPLAVDGLLQDWAARRMAPVYEDPEGDGAAVDLRNVYAAFTADKFCVAADWHGPLSGDAVVNVRVRDVRKRVVQVGLDKRNGRVWLERGAVGEADQKQWATDQFADVGWFGDVVEICLPRVDSEYGFRDQKLWVNVTVYDPRAAGTPQHVYDAMGSWWQPVDAQHQTVR